MKGAVGRINGRSLLSYFVIGFSFFFLLFGLLTRTKVSFGFFHLAKLLAMLMLPDSCIHFNVVNDTQTVDAFALTNILPNGQLRRQRKDNNACRIVPVDCMAKHVCTYTRPHIHTYMEFGYFRHVPDTMSYDDCSIACNTFTFDGISCDGMKIQTFIDKDEPGNNCRPFLLLASFPHQYIKHHESHFE